MGNYKIKEEDREGGVGEKKERGESKISRKINYLVIKLIYRSQTSLFTNNCT